MLQDLGTLLATKLPLDTEKYNGDYKKYERFKTKFCTLIAANSFAGPKERATQLYNSLSDHVIDQLDHVPDLDRPGAYERLWSSLDWEFNRFQYGPFSHVQDLQSIRTWPKCETASDLDKLYKFVRFHYKTLEQAGQEAQAEAIKVTLLGKLKGRAASKSSTLIKQSGNRPVLRQMLEYMRNDIDDMELREMAEDESRSLVKTHTRPTSRANYINANSPEELNVYANQHEVFVQPSQTSHDPNVQREYDCASPVNYVGNGARPREPKPQGGVQWPDGYKNQHAPSSIYEGRGNTTNRGNYTPRSPPGSPRMQNAQQYERQRELEERFKHKCIYCITDDHESEECTKFSPHQCKDILYRYKLCFNCKCQGHPWYRCAMPKKCTKSCSDSGKHCTSVCTQGA